MDTFLNSLLLLGNGIVSCLSIQNIICCAIGSIIGSLIGVLPGIGISGTIAILLPITYGMDTLTALIMISGVFFGAKYGGAISSILVNIPGEATSIVTCFDGHPLALKGQGGKALSVAAISSFIGGLIGILGLTVVSTTVARIALEFGKVEFFSLVLVGLVLLTTLGSKSIVKGLVSVCLGILIGCIGIDEVFGSLRFTFGVIDLYKGIDFVTFIMGVYGLTELMYAISTKEEESELLSYSKKDLMPTKKDFKKILPIVLRCSGLGFFMGLIPGAGGTLSTFFAYGMERSLSKHPEQFGTGIIEGVAAPECTDNAANYGQMVPLLSLGLPFTSGMAMLLSAFIVHGITPGPLFISEHPDIFWGLIGSMLIGNVLLLIINLPLVGIWASMLKVDFSILMPLITFVTFAGGYAINTSLFDLGVMLVCGVIGFFLSASGYNMAALSVSVYLCGTLEDAFLGTMTLYKGNLISALIDRPFGGIVFILACVILVVSVVKSIRNSFSKGEKRIKGGEYEEDSE